MKFEDAVLLVAVSNGVTADQLIEETGWLRAKVEKFLASRSGQGIRASARFYKAGGLWHARCKEFPNEPSHVDDGNDACVFSEKRRRGADVYGQAGDGE